MTPLSSSPSSARGNQDKLAAGPGLTRYIWLAAALVVVANGGILLFQWSRVPVARPPKQHLQEQAFAMGQWKSLSVQSPPERVLAVGADEMAESQYERDGSTVFAHRASWTSQSSGYG